MGIPAYRERAPDGEASGLLVLHHGRGADEHDLLPLADALDPARRLHVVTPRAPLDRAGLARQPLVCGPARRLSRPESFPRLRALAALPRRAVAAHRPRARAHRARRLLDGLGDELRAGPRRRATAPAGILALLRLHPDRRGLVGRIWQDRRSLRAFIAHGDARSRDRRRVRAQPRADAARAAVWTSITASSPAATDRSRAHPRRAHLAGRGARLAPSRLS